MRKEDKDFLKDRKSMREKGFFMVETPKILAEADDCGMRPEKFFYSENAPVVAVKYAQKFPNAEKVRRADIDKFSEIESNQGFLAVFKAPECSVKSMAGPMVLLDTVQDPSNVGAIIRSGVAFGFENFLLLNSASCYSEKAVRASAGSVFKAKCRPVSMKEAEEALRDREVLVTDVGGGEQINAAVLKKMKDPVVVLGSEGKGVSARIKSMASRKVNIGINPKVESLNVAAAAAIIFYELSRQDKS